MTVESVSEELTVFFEDPFWVGVFERVSDGRLSVAKITFGAEPQEADVYRFVLDRFDDLRFSRAVATAEREKKINPKKARRDVRKKMSEKGVGTKAQQAIKAQREQNKLEKEVRQRERRKADAEKRFEMKQQKKAEKHKGH